MAQARQTLGLFRTADRGSYTVSFAAAGAGATREAAEAAAQAACRVRTRSGDCDIAASACAAP